MELVALLVIAIGTASVFCLILAGLLEAPWPVLLGGLLLALYGLQRVSDQNQALADLPAPASRVQKGGEAQSAVAANVLSSTQLLSKERPSQNQAEISSQSTVNPTAFIEGTYRGHRWRRPVSTPAQTNGTPLEVVYRGQKVQVFKSEQS